MTHLTIRLLQSFQVTLADQPVTTFKSAKVQTLLAYLAVEADRPHRRETLAGLLWPDQTEQLARRNLSQALFHLRQAINDAQASPPFLLTTSQTIQLNPASDCEVDVTTFAQHLAAAQSHDHPNLAQCATCRQHLQQAVDLYRGRFLAGFSVADSDLFEEWVLVEQEQLYRQVQEALTHLVAYHEDQQEYEPARSYARRRISLDPLNETAHYDVMRLFALSGQRSAALAQYETCRQILAEELGVEPTAEMTALYEQIRAGEVSDQTKPSASPVAQGIDEAAYREQIKARYGEEAAYYIPLAGETTEVGLTQPVAKAPRSLRRRQQRARAEYHEWIQTGPELRWVKLDTLRAAVDKYPCIILLGDPGSGKTTTLEHLAYQFADEAQWLPLPLRLSEFRAGLTLEDFIEQTWTTAAEAGAWDQPFGTSDLASYLEAGRLFFLFDALNEMPHTDSSERILALRRFIDQWSAKGNRFLVTCRVLDYGEELTGLQRVVIQPLGETQIKQFLQNELPQDWATLWQLLIKQDSDQRSLLEMARNPYLLTMMIDIFVEGGELGQNRAELMRRFTQILLGWAKEKCSPNEWLEAEVQAGALAVMAFEMQQRAGCGSAVETGLVKTVIPSQVQTDPAWPARPSPPDQVLTLAAQANIIEMPIDRSSVRFYHQLLQEYFAARHLLKQDFAKLSQLWAWPWLESEMPPHIRPADNYDPLPPPRPTGWEEATMLATEMAPENDNQLVQTLIQVNPVLAGRCLHQGRAKVDMTTRQQVIEALLSTIARPEVALRVRIAAGEMLGYLGDPRLGEMITVPAGDFFMGEGPEQHPLFLPAYQFGKYLVTNAEFGRFIEAGGYQDKAWWTEAGWAAKEGPILGNEPWREPRHWQDPYLNKPNQPVVGVNWYESVAYCRWLSAESGQTYRLPSEAEWEKAARGGDGRVYPWGNDYQAKRLNNEEGQAVLTTTPVGIYPTGVSAFGAFDCAGNVWEWCATKVSRVGLKPYPYDANEDEWSPDYLDGRYVRVLRGGSWFDNQDVVRCAYRTENLPYVWSNVDGFRLVSPVG